MLLMGPDDGGKGVGNQELGRLSGVVLAWWGAACRAYRQLRPAGRR